jgi:hypothetical protein
MPTGQWFSPGTPGSFTNIADRPDITELLLKGRLNTINQTKHTSTSTAEWPPSNC